VTARVVRHVTARVVRHVTVHGVRHVTARVRHVTVHVVRHVTAHVVRHVTAHVVRRPCKLHHRSATVALCAADMSQLLLLPVAITVAWDRVLREGGGGCESERCCVYQTSSVNQ
jgi:hypothetical protein